MSRGANNKKSRKRPHAGGKGHWCCCDYCHKGWGIQNPDRPLPQELRQKFTDIEEIEVARDYSKIMRCKLKERLKRRDRK